MGLRPLASPWVPCQSSSLLLWLPSDARRCLLPCWCSLFFPRWSCLLGLFFFFSFSGAGFACFEGTWRVILWRSGSCTACLLKLLVGVRGMVRTWVGSWSTWQIATLCLFGEVWVTGSHACHGSLLDKAFFLAASWVPWCVWRCFAGWSS